MLFLQEARGHVAVVCVTMTQPRESTTYFQSDQGGWHRFLLDS